MMGNGMTNLVAAALIAGAILWNGGFGSRAAEPGEKDYAEWYARAVGDIKTDVVVNCGCCGDEGRKVNKGSF